MDTEEDSRRANRRAQINLYTQNMARGNERCQRSGAARRAAPQRRLRANCAPSVSASRNFSPANLSDNGRALICIVLSTHPQTPTHNRIPAPAPSPAAKNISPHSSHRLPVTRIVLTAGWNWKLPFRPHRFICNLKMWLILPSTLSLLDTR